MRVWFVSNGRGEDRTAALVARHLRAAAPGMDVLGAPIVGAGEEYSARSIPVAVRGAQPASGGFSTLSLPAFIRDIPELPAYLGWSRSVRRLTRTGDRTVVVGDAFALLLARAAIGPADVFVSLAKSSMHLPHTRLDRSIIRRMVRQAFTRDAETADALRRKRIEARFVGNPLMDDLDCAAPPREASPAILLLPGSRGEAARNLGILLEVLEYVGATTRGICALVSSIDDQNVRSVAWRRGWSWSGGKLSKAGRIVELWRDRFPEAVLASAIAIGMAGTANEQAAGLGCVVVTCPGSGPEACRARLKAQERLLGGAAVFVDGPPLLVAAEVTRLLGDHRERARRAQAGADRMGPPGASARIAAYLAAAWSGRP